MRLTEEGRFVTEGGKELNVYAKKARGRWQYRMGSHTGPILASGMDPAAFVREFWKRDDFAA